MFKDDLINNLHKEYRNDNWLQELFNSTGITLDKLFDDIGELENQYWFDGLTWSIPLYEKRLGIKINPLNCIEDKRAAIEAKFKSDGKSNVELLQSVANSWKNGVVKVEFINGAIKIIFVGETGIPSDLDCLIKSLNEIKPAHLQLEYVFKFILWNDVLKKKWNEINTYTWDEIKNRM